MVHRYISPGIDSLERKKAREDLFSAGFFVVLFGCGSRI